MNFSQINLEKTKSAIKTLTKNNKNFKFTVKNVRWVNNIKSSNKSKINFTWRSLDKLIEDGILEVEDLNSKPKKYKLTLDGKSYFKRYRKENIVGLI